MIGHVITPAEIAEAYKAILSRTEDKDRARQCLEAYLAGINGMLPRAVMPACRIQPRGKNA